MTGRWGGCGALLLASWFSVARADESMLDWTELPPMPNELGVAGPFAGVHQDALIVAGGANFPTPVWESDKEWHAEIHLLVREGEGFAWKKGGELPRPLAYGAAVSTDEGVVCMGGNDAEKTFADVFLLRHDPSADRPVTIVPYPPLPQPCAYGSAAKIGDVIYLAGGQSATTLDSAMNNLWSLDLSQRDDPESFRWKVHPPMPCPARAFNVTAAQHDGYRPALYVISGRREQGDQVEFLRDVWQFTPETGEWKRRRDAPRCVMAAPGIDFGQSHIFILGGADGSLFDRSDQLKDRHPGFPKEALAYHTITDTWAVAGPIPRNHVTTIAVKWGDDLIVPSGEVRPRVRSPKVWRVTPRSRRLQFGMINYGVLTGYLLAMVAIGFYFARRNKSTDDYFRGGKSLPWWAAGCSIFATMLSSLTYTGIPSKAYAQDWVLAVGNFMIPLVAVVAVLVALPFYRRIDATSAYEYLERRFNRGVRLFGSASFTLFHIFRMAVVMSLTGLALSAATPLTPAQSVIVMGTLSILYCTAGGIEAVVWTDTVQTFVLLGGAIFALAMLIQGIDGGIGGWIESSADYDKFTLANLHGDPTHAQVALWVIVVGGIAQNVSSYTADQAVVQRYMTTETEAQAARSIWTNAGLSIAATLLFFAIGTALFAFYRAHPEKLDPTMNTDQVFPLFIAHELPTGVSGLIVAGIFAAAQSTVSTSMNSTATTVVTDFLRPLGWLSSDRAYLRAAQLLTFLIGVAGTCVGLIFVDPEIKSLFDQFIRVIGLFMGVLGGLFVLGALTRRANGVGAMVGALVGAGVMYAVWKYSSLSGFLYTAIGIASCFVVGYLVSLLVPTRQRDLTGLTVYTLNP